MELEIMCTIVTVKEKEVLKNLLEDLEEYITKSTSNDELNVNYNLGFTNYIATKKEYMNIINKHFDPKQIYVLCVNSKAINESCIKEQLEEKGFSNGIIIIQDLRLDVYNLINSKAISEHCRKIQHQFNTEEIAVLIYRNKSMSIEEKIQAYQELISDYPDMEVIERFNCKHYDSVKDMIKGEIARLENLIKILKKDEQDVVYSYNYWCNSENRIIEGKDEFRDIYKTFNEVIDLINEEIKEDEEDELLSFCITKRTVSKKEKYHIRAEYILDEYRHLQMVNIYDFESDWLDISNICLNIPTPFKKRRCINC